MIKDFANIITKFLWVVIFYFVIHNLVAQESQLRFTAINVKDGLSQNLINAIAQDSVGFMWFGTKDGLNRYDGYSFKVYRTEIGDSTSLSDNYITSLYLDSKGRLWVGTRNGLNLFDAEHDRFYRINDYYSEDSEERKNGIPRILEDWQGIIWAAYEDGDLISVQTTVETHLAKTFRVNIFKIAYDEESIQLLDFSMDGKKIWLATNQGLYRADFEETSGIHAKRISKEVVHAFKNTNEFLWCGCNGSLLRINKNDNSGNPTTFNLFGEDPQYLNWLYMVSDIIEKDEHTFLVATLNGLVIFDKVTGNSKVTRARPNDITSLTSNNLRKLFIDKSKNLWIGTGGYGINKSNLLTNRFEYYRAAYRPEETLSIQLIKEDAFGDIWFTDMGSLLFKLDPETGEVKPGPPAIEPQIFYDFYSQPDGSNWRLTDSLLLKYNSYQKLTERYSIHSIPDNLIIFERIISASSQSVWIAARNALVCHNIKAKTFSVFHYPLEGEFAVLSVYADSLNNYWIGTEIGLFRYNKDNGKWQMYQQGENSLSNERVKSICSDPLNPGKYIWLGTDGGGLNKLDIETSEIEVFTTQDGLPNGVVYGILTDNQNNLWLSTNNGLSRFNPITRQFRNYNVFDGLQDNEFNSLSFYKTRNGRLYFGGINGITAFLPDDLVSNTFVPNVFLTGFKIFNKEVSSTDNNSPLENEIGYTQVIHLPYNQNNFSFSFAALDFTAPQNNKYKYKLDGFDADWIDNGTLREAYYTNVPPGSYILRVLGSNNDGVWNEEGTSLQIVITPPVWARWWAYLLYSVFGILFLYFIWRLTQKRNLLKLQVVESGLEKKKLEELNALKSRFFANISHEFRTPLTLIMDPAEELESKLKNSADKKALEKITQNSKQLLRLVNQLLDLSKLEASKLPVSVERINIARTLRYVTENLKPLADAKNIDLVIEHPVEELQILFDRDILEKIINNLISNAVKFSEAGCLVVVRLEMSSKAPEFRIYITDNGRGIPEKELMNIFDGFYRSSLTKLEDGYGIGLAYVKELVSLVNGSIDVISREKEGSSFKLTFPLVLAASNSEVDVSGETDRSNEEFPAELVTKKDEGKKVILVVEDNQEIREHISEKLSPYYTVVPAMDGRTGLDKTRSLLPDLVISDIMMPELDGLEFCRIIKSELATSHIPIILLTARTDENSKLAGLEYGADDYMTKPFSSKELLARVASIFRNRETWMEKFRLTTPGKPATSKLKTRDEEFMDKVYSFIYERISEESLSVEDLADEIGLSYSQVYRKIKSLTGLTTIQLVTKCRVSKAAELLQTKTGNVSEVAYDVGFSNPSYFAQCFRNEYNCSPSEYLQKI